MGAHPPQVDHRRLQPHVAANDRLDLPGKALVAQHKVAIRGPPNLIHQSGLQFVPEQLPISRLPPFRILPQCRVEPVRLDERGCLTFGIGPIACRETVVCPLFFFSHAQQFSWLLVADCSSNCVQSPSKLNSDTIPCRFSCFITRCVTPHI